MSDVKNGLKLFIAKIKNITTQYGNMQKIYINNTEPTKADGSPDTYFKGILVWYLPDGTGYQVKQLGIQVPKNGMLPNDVNQGFSAHITLDLADEKFAVKKLG